MITLTADHYKDTIVNFSYKFYIDDTPTYIVDKSNDTFANFSYFSATCRWS